MGNKLRALLRLVDQLFDSDSDPFGHGTSRQRGLQVIEARRPIVRLRQQSRPDNGGRSHHERSLPELRESVEKRRLEYLQTRRENTFSMGSSSLGNYSGSLHFCFHFQEVY